MSVSSTDTFKWRIIGVVLFALAVFLIVVASSVPPGSYRFLGGALTGAGAMNILFYRRFGRQTFDSTRSMRPSVAIFWERIGEKGTQFLYLGIGIVLALAGFFVLMRSARN
jgi:hypothetical protein